VSHASLLSANLHDSLVVVLRCDHCFAFGQIVRQRLLNVHILAGLAGIDGKWNVPVIRRCDQHGIHIFPRE
jgi:hypothetical protein